MKRGGRLRSFTPIRRRTPLKSTGFPKPRPKRGARTTRLALTAVRESAPARRRGTTVGASAVESASPSSLAFPKPDRKAKAPRRMKKKRARRIDRETPREKLYKSWIHSQPCCGYGNYSPLGNVHLCNGRIEQSHERNMTGLGLKSNNLRSVAMCAKFHGEWEEHRGFFKNWGKELRRVWFAARIAEANARFEADHPEAVRAA